MEGPDDKAGQPDSRVTARTAATAILCLALLLPLLANLYRDAVNVPLDTDGRYLTYDNAFVKAPDALRQLWTHDFFAGAETLYPYVSGYYRPLTNTLLWAEYHLAGTDDAQYNAHGVVLHWVNCLLVALLAFTLIGSLPVALLAALLFAVHPANAFAATQTKARADLLFATCYLGGLAAFAWAWTAKLDVRSKRCAVGLATLASAAAILSKEAAATFPMAVVLLVLILPSDQPRGRGLLWTLPMWAVLAAYVLLRAGLGIQPHADVGGYAQHSAAVLYANALKGFSIYTVRLVLPWGADYPELCPNLVNFIDPELRDPLIALSIVLAVSLALAALRCRNRVPAVALLLGLYLVGFAPLLAVRNIAGTLSPDHILAQERWAYLPNAAGIIVVASAALWLWQARPERLWRLSVAGSVAAALLILASMASVHAREADGWLAQLKQYVLVPDARLGRFERANKLILWAELVSLRRGQSEDAERRCREAVDIAPDSPIPATALAYVLGEAGRWTEVPDVLATWHRPPSENTVRWAQTNARVFDDLNRIGPQLAYLLGRGWAARGNAAAATDAFCEAMRRGYDPSAVSRWLTPGDCGELPVAAGGAGSS